MSATDAQHIAVLIPALNEERAIRHVVTSVLAICPNVIVVDDGSTDRTVEHIQDLPIILIRHDSPKGKGEGLRDGFREALRRGFDAVVTMDGDGQHIAADIPRLLAAAARYPEHLVIGARLFRRERQPKARQLANNFADWGISWACAHPVVDTQSGQRYYPRATLELVDIITNPGFVYETELLIEACRRHVPVVSVPIASRYEGEFRASHFKPLRDFLRITCYVVGHIVRGDAVCKSYRDSRQKALVVSE